jgi:hypothetical protein
MEINPSDFNAAEMIRLALSIREGVLVEIEKR